MVQKVLLFFGERLTLVLFLIFTIAFLFSGYTVPVFSEHEDPASVKPGMSWYQQGVFFPVARANESGDYEIAVATITPTPTPSIVPFDPANTDIWERLAECESHRNWADDTGNGYYGG